MSLAAAASTEDLADLKSLLEVQNQKIEQQNQLIATLAKRLEALEQSDQELRHQLQQAREQAATVQAEDAAEKPASVEGNLLAAAEAPAPPPDDATGNLLDDVVVRGDFPRSFKIPGTDISLQVDGYVKFDFVYDDGVVLSGTRLFPDTIRNDDGDGVTRFSAEQSRVSLFAQAPSPIGRVSGFVEADFFGASRGARLRHAYGRLGPVLAGQTWSTFMDPYALPQTVALTAPSGSIFKRPVQIRWTRPLRETTQLAVALEEPGGDFQVSDIARRLSRWPDLVATLRHSKQGLGHLQLGGVLRRLEAGTPDNTVVATGWGLSLTGRVKAAEDGSFIAGALFGNGIGSYITGLATSPSAAVLVDNGALETLEAFGGYLGYRHVLSRELRTNLMVGYAEIDNLDVQPGSAVRSTTNAGVNLIWSPRPGMGVGAEFLYGERQNKDGTEGINHRFQLAIQFGF